MSTAQVRLRPITETDLPDYVKWLNDPEVTEFTTLESGSITLEHEREWFRAISAPDCSARNWAIEADGRHIGACDLVPDDLGQQAYVGIIIGDTTAWGKGYGTAALREVLRIGFQELNLHRIRLDCHAGNARGLRCYEKCGFRHEGIARQARFKRGRWVDVVQMAILREEWEAMRAEADVAGDGVHIRGYRPDDYAAVIELWRDVGFSVDNRDGTEALSRHVLLNPGLFLIAETVSAVVGTVLASWDGRRSIVYRMAVDPGWQRRGIGTQLIAEVERRLKTLGARSVALLAPRDDQRAVGFYEALGYEIGEGVAFMMKGLDATEESGDGPECC